MDIFQQAGLGLTLVTSKPWPSRHSDWLTEEHVTQSGPISSQEV
jgi:hypothetical protein